MGQGDDGKKLQNGEYVPLSNDGRNGRYKGGLRVSV